ncbi:MAG: metallophosphoesterase family protein [Chloroflexi bacterium]|nr:metallophosphoesterase family protein [Chloroflexota bacterium]
MRVGLLSDTHVPEAEKAIPPEVVEAFRGVDLILHAGDIFVPAVLDELQRIAPVLAALGDDDYPSLFYDKRVQEKQVLTLEGQILWLTHYIPDSPEAGWWLSSQGQRWLSLEQIRDGVPDIVVFGHLHRPVMERIGGTLFINPGSPTFMNYGRGLGTVAILDIDSTEPEAHIVQL